MKKFSHCAMICLGLAALISSCSKGDATTPPPAESAYPSLARAYDEVAPKSKIVTLNAATGGSFFGNSGTRYVFPANVFQNAAGIVVTGNVTLEVLECLKESDMIFAKMLTVSGGTPLISAGAVSIKATQAGSPVYIRSGMRYDILLPTNTGTATAGMSYFTGQSTVSVPGSNVTWTLSKDTAARVVYNGDTIRMTPDSVGFVNCDKFPASDLITINVKLNGFAGTLKQSDFFSYYLLEGMTSAVPLYSTTKAFTDNMYENVKVLRMNAHYVVCAIIGGDFYGGMLKSISPVEGRTYTISLVKTTPTAFKKEIDALK